MSAYYNDNDPYVCAWLRNLIAAGLIAPGDVDARSIRDVKADDLSGYTQCHFFAGIGGWSYALRLAGWPDDRPVWTGSCPCQPLSVAGQRKGHADERHLWPAFHSLISECAPAIVFGEQTPSKDGREWLAGVRADLEAVGYACGAADLCAASVAAPHKRQRLYWLANAYGGNSSTGGIQRGGEYRQWSKDGRNSERLGIGVSVGLEGPERQFPTRQAFSKAWTPSQFIACPDGLRRVPIEPELFPLADGVPSRMGKVRGSGNAIVPQVAAEFIAAYLDIAEAA